MPWSFFVSCLFAIHGFGAKRVCRDMRLRGMLQLLAAIRVFSRKKVCRCAEKEQNGCFPVAIQEIWRKMVCRDIKLVGRFENIYEIHNFIIPPQYLIKE